MTQWCQLMFQDAASPIMLQMMAFHDHALLVLTLVITFVGYALVALMFSKYTCRYITEAQQVETVWTIVPALMLLFLALPSLRLLYLTDEMGQPSLSVKAIGHQWYWSYEYSDFPSVEYDSYMIPTDDLHPGEFRLLEVDNRMVVPMQLEIRLLVTAADVIHSWCIPSLGMKIDGIPGRLNQLAFTVSRPGIFYGQCSEICGANHTFMPIALEAIDTNSFINWTSSFSNWYTS